MVPTIAMAAHVDTATSASGKVSPMVHEYTEGDLSLPHGDVIIPSDSPGLTRLKEMGGGRVITGMVPVFLVQMTRPVLQHSWN